MKQESILQKRWKKFKGLKRGYYSLCILLGLYFISFFLPLIINNRALIVSYGGDLYFPVISGYIPGKQFGQDVPVKLAIVYSREHSAMTRETIIG